MFSRYRPLLLIAALAAVRTAALVPSAAGAQSLAPASAAADATGRPDPLGHLVAEALKANLGLEQERLAERRESAEVAEARALLLPSISLESRYSHFEGGLNVGDLVNPAYEALNQLTGTQNFPTDIDLSLPPQHDSRLRLTQPIFNETIRSNFALARAQHDVQRSQLAAAARRLAAEVQTAYLTEAAARRGVEIFAATLAVVQENERVAERLLAAGRATPEAFHRARADHAELQQQYDGALERHAAAARELNRILLRPLEQPVEVIPDSAFDLPLDITSDEAVARALANREELRQADAGISAAHAGKRVATAGFMPSAALALDYGYQSADLAFRDDDDFWAASVIVSWSVFNSGRDPARRAAAGYDEDRARAARRDLADKIALDARNAHQAAVVARAAIATADTRLEAARRTWTLVRRRFEEGAASSFELVDARATLTNAELNRVLTAYRYAIRWVDVERAAALRVLPRATALHDLPPEKGSQP